MRITRLLLLTALLLSQTAFCQVIIVPTGLIVASVVPEHGFLPGKKFQFYPLIGNHDLEGSRFRIELSDERTVANLKKIRCSEEELTNTSEFADPKCIFTFGQYVDTLLLKSNAIVDSLAKDTLRIKLEALDAQLIGIGYVRAHGLCQMDVSCRHFQKSYCIDITDADKDSPVGLNAFVTRLTATRIIGSAALRGIIEQLISDLVLVKSGKKPR